MNQRDCNFNFNNNIFTIYDKNNEEILSTVLYRDIIEEFLIKLCEEKDLKKDYELNEKIFVNFNKGYILHDSKKYFIKNEDINIFKNNFLQSLINLYRTYLSKNSNEEKNFTTKFRYILFVKDELMYYIYNDFEYAFEINFHIFKSYKNKFYKDETFFIFNDSKCLSSKRIIGIDIDNNLVIIDENFSRLYEETASFNNTLIKFLKYHGNEIVDSVRYNDS